jgi:hypothetical protein
MPYYLVDSKAKSLMLLAMRRRPSSFVMLHKLFAFNTLKNTVQNQGSPSGGKPAILAT